MCVCDFVWVKERRSNLGSLGVEGVETWEGIYSIWMHLVWENGNVTNYFINFLQCIC